MKLSEKIYYYRKKNGLSQEALAESLGVSRQAVSKWETGESVPEVGKIISISEVFNITTDELLSNKDPKKDKDTSKDNNESFEQTYAARSNQTVNNLGKATKRYSWLTGIYLVIIGVAFVIFSFIVKSIHAPYVNSIDILNLNERGAGLGSTSDSLNIWARMSQNFSSKDPFIIFRTTIILIGLALIIIGIILAIYLKKKFKEVK